jgi:uncharacterized repeat protein (TIGR03803 family)
VDLCNVASALREIELSSQGNGTWTETVLHSFSGNPDGTEPRGAIALDAKGNLYGATSGGGGNTEGIVFKLALQVSPPWKETVLYNFQSAMDGSQPLAGVLLDNANHRLYGTTNHGRSRLGYGTIFVIQP